MRIAYPVEVSRRGRVFLAACPDVLEVSAWGATREQARGAARARLMGVLRDCVKARRDIPRPTRAPRRNLLEPPLLLAAKLALYQAMRDEQMTNVALAMRLGLVEGTVRRLLNPDQRSHVGQVESALAALDRRLVAEVWPAE